MPRETHGRIELERRIDSITVGVRHRKDLGDIAALMRSIELMGLLQPVTITPDGVLVCGARRLEAMRRLGNRTVQVWVRSGISDELGQILAQQDENAMHKPLSTLEAETLYREAKKLLAEDAARRQASTRFGACSQGAADGAGESPAPRGSCEARVQAARLATGSDSHQRLEHVGWLKSLANESRTPPHIRGMAIAALEAIRGGAPVDPAYRRVRAALQLGRAGPIDEEELGRLAAESLARIKQDKASKRTAKTTPKPALLGGRSVRSFVLTWTELEGWTQAYDADVLARELVEEEWDRFERVLAESVAFAQRLRDLRAATLRSA